MQQSPPEELRSFGVSYPLAFLAKTAVGVACACAVGLVLLRWVFYRELGSDFAQAFYTLKGVLAFLAPALAFCLLAVLLVGALAVFSVAVFASHKVAGPLFRLQRVGGHLKRGILVGRIHLRTGDQGKLVAAELNRWGMARKTRLAALAADLETLSRALREAELQTPAGESTPAVPDWDRVRHAAAALVTRIHSRESARNA